MNVVSSGKTWPPDALARLMRRAVAGTVALAFVWGAAERLEAGGSEAIITVDHTLPHTHDNEWRFRVTPYLWAAGISGDFAQFGLPPVEAHAGFGDIVDHLDFGFMTVFEAWRGRAGILGDFMHIRLGGSGEIEALPFTARFSSTTTTGMLAGQYRILDSEDAHLDAFAGLRLWSLETEISVGNPINRSRGDGADWTDPIIGLKGWRSLSPRTYLTGWAMAGAGGGADFTIDLLGGIGYKLSERTAIILAYRYQAVDYRDSPFVFDVVQQGFGLGLDFRF